MTAVRGDDGELTGVIKCDSDKCAAVAPDISVESAPNGLIGLGWECRGGKHYCTHCAAVRAGNMELELKGNLDGNHP